LLSAFVFNVTPVALFINPASTLQLYKIYSPFSLPQNEFRFYAETLDKLRHSFGKTKKSPNIADGAFEYYFKPSNAIAILNPFEFCMPPPLLICYLIIHCYANM
jgi:hypothetical protein